MMESSVCWNNARADLVWDYGEDPCNTCISTATEYLTGVGTGEPHLFFLFSGPLLEVYIDDCRQSINLLEDDK